MIAFNCLRTIFFLLLVLFISCGHDEHENNSITTNTATTTRQEVKEPEIFDYPVVYKNWQMGDHENTRVVLQMYKAWDTRSIDDMKPLLADSVTFNLPGQVRHSSDKVGMIEFLLKQRRKYQYASNDIISAFPVVNKETNDEWVNVLSYNKWKYTDGVRDSMLYQDLWKIRNGKIRELISLEQLPSRIGIRKIETLVNDK